MANSFCRIWAGAETCVLAGHSYGSFLALDYAINHPTRLSGLILIDAWTVGTIGAMGALASILTSDKIQVDKDRQVRVWSGNLLSNQDYQEAITEILPFYTPPEGAVKKASTTFAESSTTSAAPLGQLQIHHETQNWAFGHNMPRFDVRPHLKDIKVSLSSPSLDEIIVV